MSGRVTRSRGSASSLSMRSDDERSNSQDASMIDDGVASGTVTGKAQFMKLTNDESYHRKFIISKFHLFSGGLYSLRHPRSSPTNTNVALYHIDGARNEVSEVLKIGDGRRSMFFGESVVADGTLIMICPVHPLFLAIHYLRKNAKDLFLRLEDILEDDQLPAVQLLAENESLLKALTLAVESKEIDDCLFYRYNEEKMIEWLSKRYEILLQSLIKHGYLGKHILNDEAALRRYAFGIFCDFIPDHFDIIMKQKLEIKDPEHTAELVKMSSFKKRQSTDNANNGNVPAKKSSTVAKKLQQASHGTKSLMSFFTKK